MRPAWAPLVTEFLNQAGYRSYHSGKWHVDGERLSNGFAHSYQVGCKAEINCFKPDSNREDGESLIEASKCSR